MDRSHAVLCGLYDYCPSHARSSIAWRAVDEVLAVHMLAALAVQDS